MKKKKYDGIVTGPYKPKGRLKIQREPYIPTKRKLVPMKKKK